MAKRETRRSAAEAGRHKFLSETPCSLCDAEMRYTSNGRCVECSLRSSREKYEEIKRLMQQAAEEA